MDVFGYSRVLRVTVALPAAASCLHMWTSHRCFLPDIRRVPVIWCKACWVINIHPALCCHLLCAPETLFVLHVCEKMLTSCQHCSLKGLSSCFLLFICQRKRTAYMLQLQSIPSFEECSLSSVLIFIKASNNKYYIKFTSRSSEFTN